MSFQLRLAAQISAYYSLSVPIATVVVLSFEMAIIRLALVFAAEKAVFTAFLVFLFKMVYYCSGGRNAK